MSESRVTWWQKNRKSQRKKKPKGIFVGQNETPGDIKPSVEPPGEIEPFVEGLVVVVAKTHDELIVFETIFAQGSDGTILLEGNLSKQSVAVKRLFTKNYQLAMNAMRTVIRADEHPNIVRYHALYRNDEFTFLSLEGCTCNLRDVITASFDDPNYINGLWGTTFLSPKLLTLLRDVVSGLEHLHKLGIIHRDLRPENMLISIGKDSFCAKISDMGICKQLPQDGSSVSSSSGWVTWGQLSLCCVIYYCVIQESHPFGEPPNREVNIMNNNYDTSSLVCFPEALDLISNLLSPKPTERSKASGKQTTDDVS
ncbi:hypothetical protein L1049_027144 [Liquidambar formosana]|uniref:Protein kinase domain-containing protein n=1 Tax=Liquidambar formosana TaxID=63359 RepID=A0AAP0N860_LIQFO